MQKKSIYSIGSLLLLLVFFVVASMLSSNLLRGLRFDLTENQLYTLSSGTRNILHDLQEPVEATAFGLQAVPVGASGDSLYLGIAGSNSLDDMQAMPFLQPSKEKFLEYDLAKMISSLGNPERKTLGLMSSLPLRGGFDPATQAAQPAWVLHEQLSQLFQIEEIDATAGELPEDLDVLMLIHPKDLDMSMQYQVEQFVLGGGHLIAYLDPFAEMDRGNPADPMAQLQAGSASSLGSMLDAWGVEYDPARVIGDLQFGIGTSRSRHIGILSVTAEGLDDEDIITSDLEVVNFSSVGWFSAKNDARTRFEPLVMSSENAAPMDSSRLRFLTNPADLMTDFNPTGERYALAARVTGEAKASIEAPQGTDDEHLATAGEAGINVVLVADTDALSDRLWIQRQPFFGQDITTAFADNGSFAVNVVDNLLGNRDLISIRTRASSGRPFDRVDDIRVAAEKSYRATEERLQMELEDTERKLTELQAAKGESELTVISPEQQQEIQRFVDRKFEIRRELRQVQHDLQRDINSLGTRLKLLNIALVPAIVMVIALVYGSRMRRKRTRPQLNPVENP